MDNKPKNIPMFSKSMSTSHNTIKASPISTQIQKRKLSEVQAIDKTIGDNNVYSYSLEKGLLFDKDRGNDILDYEELKQGLKDGERRFEVLKSFFIGWKDEILKLLKEIENNLEQKNEEDLKYQFKDLSIFCSNMGQFFKIYKNEQELISICILDSTEFILPLINLWYRIDDKGLHYITVNLLIEILIACLGFNSTKLCTELIFKTVFNSMRGINANETVNNNNQFINATYQSIYSGLSFYHLIFKHFRAVKYDKKFYDKPHVLELPNLLKINENLSSFITSIKNLIKIYPDLEFDFLVYGIDLVKESPLNIQLDSVMCKFIKELISIKTWNNLAVVRKRLELCKTLVLSKSIDVSLWLYVLDCIINYGQLIKDKSDSVGWGKVFITSESTLITDEDDLSMDSLIYNFEGFRSFLLTGTLAILKYLTLKRKQINTQLNKDNKAFILFEAQIMDLLNLIDYPESFNTRTQLNYLFFIFLPSQPCLYKLMTIMLKIKETTQKVLNEKLLKDDEKDKILVKKIQLLNEPVPLIIRFLESNDYDRQLMIKVFHDKDKDGIEFFLTLIYCLSNREGWTMIFKSLCTMPRKVYFHFSLYFIQSIPPIKMAYEVSLSKSNLIKGLNHEFNNLDIKLVDFNELLKISESISIRLLEAKSQLYGEAVDTAEIRRKRRSM